jgi:FdhD protein
MSEMPTSPNFPGNPNLAHLVTEGWRYQDGVATLTQESLAQEHPLDIRLNGESLSITLCSPGSDQELALGLLFSEGRLDCAAAIAEWKHGQQPGTDCTGPISWQDAYLNPVNPDVTGNPSVTKPPAVSEASAQGNRLLIMNSACGMCGKTVWESAKPPLLSFAARLEPMTWGLSDLPTFFAMMRAGQSDFSRTGGCHAAAAFSAAGKLLSLHEDVGRHNAVDKVIGDLLQRRLIGQDADPAEPHWPALLCVSGRVAYEIVAKTYRAGFAVLAAVGAPTQLSVNHAEAWGLSLLGFCRDGRATAYTHRHRFVANTVTPATDASPGVLENAPSLPQGL